MLNVTEILKRNYVSHAEAKLVKPLVKVLEGMFHATNPVPGVRCFEMKSGNGISTIWMQVPHGRVPDGDTGMKQQQRRAKFIALCPGRVGKRCGSGSVGPGRLETAPRISPRLAASRRKPL